MRFAFVDFVVQAESSVLVMYQVIVDLRSASQIMRTKVRLIYVNLLLDRYFQFIQKVFCEYRCTQILLDHVGLHLSRGQVHIEGQRKTCRMQQLLGAV